MTNATIKTFDKRVMEEITTDMLQKNKKYSSHLIFYYFYKKFNNCFSKYIYKSI